MIALPRTEKLESGPIKAAQHREQLQTVTFPAATQTLIAVPMKGNNLFVIVIDANFEP
uniref:Uncharacterized protein n=1 Tax=Magallana gigas TaxID=29159 RepID=K1QMV4_MAGGI